MPSLFPGLDPYLEGPYWPDFHSEYIIGLRGALMRVLPDRYDAVVEERLYVEIDPGEQPRPMRPDVTVARESGPTTERSGSVAAPVVQPVLVPLLMPETVHETFIEIRMTNPPAVIAAIEVLSPANKRRGGAGRQEYLDKRQAVLTSSVHLIELDLLRGGERLPMARALPEGDHYVIVSRAARRPMAEVWAWTMRQPMPAVSIPLREPDPDVTLDLQAVFVEAFDHARYARRLRYSEALIPPVGEADLDWIRRTLQGS